MLRPAVSVLVPFAGDRADAEQMAAALAVLRLGPEDEGIVADNSSDAVLAEVELPPGWRAVPAEREGSPAHTRNTAALHSSRDWLLFLDSDTRPPPDLLERFFSERLADGVGVVGGLVLSDETQTSLAARWADSRGMTTQEHNIEHPYRPYFISACLLVRREAWDQLGGFYEGIFNGEDVDFCWRAQSAGWGLHLSNAAAVVHAHRESVDALMKQAAARGASATWVHRRWPTATRPKRPGPLQITKGLLVTPLIFLAGQRGRAGLRLLDVATQVAELRGRLEDNRARERPLPPNLSADPIELWCDEFPTSGNGWPAEEARRLALTGHPVLVVSERRPASPVLGVHDVQVRYLEDETALERLRALLAALARRPFAVLSDLGEREGGPPLRVLAPSLRRLRANRGAELRSREGQRAALAARRAARLAGRRSWIDE